MKKGKYGTIKKWMNYTFVMVMMVFFWCLGAKTAEAATTKDVDLNKVYNISQLSEGESSVDLRFTLPSKGRFKIIIEHYVKPYANAYIPTNIGQAYIDGELVRPYCFTLLGLEGQESNYLSFDPGTYSCNLSNLASINSEATVMIKFEAAGTYYGEVEGNNTYDTANEIKANITYQGSMTTKSRWGDPDDEDYYYFQLDKPAKVLISTKDTSSQNSMPAVLYKEEDNGNINYLVSLDSDSENDEFTTLRLSKGKYYIWVDSVNRCYSYELRIDVTYESAEQYEQESNDLSSKANREKTNQWYTGNINQYNNSSLRDIDWYVFDISKRSYLTVELKTPRQKTGQFYLALCNAAFQVVSDLELGSDNADVYFKTATKLVEPGKYYIYLNGSNDGWDYSIRLDQKEYVSLQKISLPSSKKMVVNQADVLTPKYSPTNASETELVWSTSNKNVVTVDSEGRISAKATGTAVITATAKHDSKIRSTCRIKVVKYSDSSSTSSKIKLNKTSAKITMNGSTQLKLNGASGKITWKSSSSSVASVSSKGKVTGKKPGKVTISATSGGKRYRCTVTVVPQKQKITYAKNQKSKSVTLKWRKVKGVKGYMIAYTTDKNFKKGVKTTTITKYSTYKKTITKLQKNKTYYFKVKSFGTYKGQRLYGAYSNAVKVRIRK